MKKYPIKTTFDVKTLLLYARSAYTIPYTSRGFNVVFISFKFQIECKDTKSREQNKRIHSFFCRDGVSSPFSWQR